MISNTSGSGTESDGQEPAGFAFSQGMVNAVEVRQMKMADPWLALSLIATLRPSRVLDLLKMGSAESA